VIKPAPVVRAWELVALEKRFGSRLVLGVYALVNGLVSIGILAGAAHWTATPFVFPSLGPTAFLLFVRPGAAASSPRNTLLGHTIGVLAGLGALHLFGLSEAGTALGEGVNWPRVGAAALSLAVTNATMVWADAPHPPAGATTLIVSLGILTTPWQLSVLLLAVAILVAQAFLINRLAGVRYPLWRAAADNETGAER
jgi:CBS-domain-containing membrane protein